MSLVLKWQSYRKFCVNCILEIHGILNMPQFLDTPRFCMIRNLNMLVSLGILKGLLILLGFWICQSSESVLEITLKNNFKFKYPRETLKNKICLEYIRPETWILFLALNNIHFLRVLEKSFRNNAPPMILSNPPSWCFPNITNGTPFSRPPMPPTLAHRSLYPFWRTTHVGTSP